MKRARPSSLRRLVPLGLLALAFRARAEPVYHWDFGSEETSPLIAHGGVHRDEPGPRPPEFPDFDATNTAVRFDGGGAYYAFADPGKNSPLDFENGDAITLEAWVNMDEIHRGANLYVIGKGRTGEPGFAKDNQNWALRVREVNGQAGVSFLFATPRGEKAGAAKDAHWHRWTTTTGFTPGSGWHHVAASYKFGDPQSVRGWIDGKKLPGAWDMGGPTTEGPVVDDDAVWIGSSMGGSPSNSFHGLIDAVAIHREQLGDDVMASRYRYEGPPRATMASAVAPASGSKAAGPATKPATAAKATVPDIEPKLTPAPPGKVLVTVLEGLAAQDHWPAPTDPPLVEWAHWLTGEFAVPRLPLRYDEWGIRQGWKPPVLVRAVADVQLPPGKQRILLRARGLSRVWVNGQVVVRAKPHGGSSDGHEPVERVPQPPLPGMRPAGFGDQEIVSEFTVGPDGRCHVVLEAVVGGKKLRPEPGEMCVAVTSPDGRSFDLLQPAPATEAASHAQPPEPLTDSAWEAVSARAEQSLAALDDTNRHAAAASQDQFWASRHAAATAWIDAHPGSPVPTVGKTDAAAIAQQAHPIDAFLAARIDRAVASAATGTTPAGKAFHETVLPVLTEQCFRCHGEKQKGGLKLNSREAVVLSGESGKPAVAPGDPAASQVIARLRSTDPEERMPPKGDGLPAEQVNAIEAWIKAGAVWPAAPVAASEVALPPITGDAAYLRRVYLDCVGVAPTEAEARAFLDDQSPDKRTRLVDRLLADERFADQWVSYWQDVLAENPNILKPSLNNSGPFRWFLHESLRDGKPLDRLVTELILLRGSKSEGGSAGFGMAADNDAPFAAKGQVLGSAFLGVELQCARCHDAPFHSSKQRDLYAVAAMLDRKPVSVPKTSTVPAAFFERKARESLIKVTLKPGERIAPVWPFEKLSGLADGPAVDALTRDPADTRERLAALITAPQNTRFSQVIVNRIWKRLIGAGFVEPAHDWEGHPPSHPELLDWLARDFVKHGYDLKHVVRLILTSDVYQREAIGRNQKAAPDRRFFTAPDRRRLTAEQVVDSLFSASGKVMAVEELSFDPDARRPADTMISLGKPCRAWMFASLSNERDRPALALPRAQAVTDVLEAFGWTGSRQSPRTDREADPTVLQPGVLGNSVMSSWVVRVSADSGLSKLAIDADSPQQLVDAIFLRFLARHPNGVESERFVAALAPGFSQRLTVSSEAQPAKALPRLSRVSWSNHLSSEATTVKFEMERRARAGEPPDPRIEPVWREGYEDFVWAVINSPEFVWVP